MVMSWWSVACAWLPYLPHCLNEKLWCVCIVSCCWESWLNSLWARKHIFMEKMSRSVHKLHENLAHSENKLYKIHHRFPLPSLALMRPHGKQTQSLSGHRLFAQILCGQVALAGKRGRRVVMIRSDIDMLCWHQLWLSVCVFVTVSSFQTLMCSLKLISSSKMCVAHDMEGRAADTAIGPVSITSEWGFKMHIQSKNMARSYISVFCVHLRFSRPSFQFLHRQHFFFHHSHCTCRFYFSPLVSVWPEHGPAAAARERGGLLLHQRVDPASGERRRPCFNVHVCRSLLWTWSLVFCVFSLCTKR